MFLIKNHFSLLFLTHSFPLIYSSPFFFLTRHVPFHLIAFTLSLVMIVSSSVFLLLLTFCWPPFHSLHLLCPLWWSPVYLFSLSSSQHLPFVLLITPSALAFVVACVFISSVYLNIDTYLSFLFPQVMNCYLQSCEPRTSGGLPLVSARKFSFIVLPWSVLPLSWASGLSLCSPAHCQLRR